MQYKIYNIFPSEHIAPPVYSLMNSYGLWLQPSNSQNTRKVTYGSFLAWGYPYIIHFNRIFPDKPSSYWGTSIYGNPHVLAKYIVIIDLLSSTMHVSILFKCSIHSGMMSTDESVTWGWNPPNWPTSHGFLRHSVFYERRFLKMDGTPRSSKSWTIT